VEPEDVELLAVCVEVERDRSAFPTCSSGAGKKTLQLGTVRVQGIEAEGDQALEAVQLASAVRRRALSERWRAKSARGQLIRGEQADPAFPPGGIPDRVGVWRLEGDEG
jgi:hypothetical protein